MKQIATEQRVHLLHTKQRCCSAPELYAEPYVFQLLSVALISFSETHTNCEYGESARGQITLKTSVNLFCRCTFWALEKAGPVLYPHLLQSCSVESQILDAGLWVSLPSPKFLFLTLSPEADAPLLKLHNQISWYPLVKQLHVAS